MKFFIITINNGVCLFIFLLYIFMITITFKSYAMAEAVVLARLQYSETVNLPFTKKKKKVFIVMKN